METRRRRRNSTRVSRKCSTVDTDFSDLIDSCRICMKWTPKMQPLFKENNVALLEKVIYCTGLELKEIYGLPSMICDVCIKNLKTSHNFKSTCLRSNEIFHNLPLNRVKIEISDEEFCNRDVDEEKVDDGKVSEEKVGEIKLADIKIYVQVDDKDSKSFGNDKEMKEELQDIWDADVKKQNDENSSDYVSEAEDQPGFRKVRSYVKKKPNYLRKKYTRQNGEVKSLEESKYFCNDCGLPFDTRMKRWLHRRSEHVAGPNDVLICEICGAIFNNKGKFSNHIKSHVPPTLECPKCDYKSATKRDLDKHISTHSDVKRYQCHYCSHWMRNISNLTSHIQRTHEGLKRFKCEHCDKWFFDKTKLNRHIDSHNNVKRYQCEYCNSCYTRRCYWKKHLEKHHGVTLPPMRPGRVRMHAKMEKICNYSSSKDILSVRETA